MSNVNRREALKVVLGGVAGLTVAETLGDRTDSNAKAESRAVHVHMNPAVGNFPSAGRYEIDSKTIFQITAADKSEIILCQSKMVVTAKSPFLNSQKRRQINLEIVDWTATGNSELLGGLVEIRATNKGTRQESYILGSEKQDFPADLVLAATFEIKTPDGKSIEQSGIMQGVIRSFPPQPADMITMEKIDVGSMPKGAAIAAKAKKGNLNIEPLIWAC